MDGSLEVVITFRVVPEPGYEPTEEELAQAAEQLAAQMVGHLEQLAAARMMDQARRQARFRAATVPSPN